jgi:hypothetical protein
MMRAAAPRAAAEGRGFAVATREDATMLLQLMQWGAQIGLEPSLSAIFAESFDPQTAPMDDPNVAIVLSFCETAGAFVKHGVLDLELLRDVLWIDGLWRQVGPHALRAREMEGMPSLYEHFEAMVTPASS